MNHEQRGSMKLCIVVGKCRQLADGRPDDFSKVFKSNDLAVQSGKDVEILKLEDGRKAFFFGIS